MCNEAKRARDTAAPIDLGEGTPIERDLQNFQGFVEIWRGYIGEHGGYIPADPYRGLIDAGVVESYDDLFGIRFVRFLPPRINPDLSKNPKWIVFFSPHEELHEQWICYADGSWARVPYGGGAEESLAQHEANDPDVWVHAMQEAGYPILNWRTRSDQDRWLSQNRGRLTWNADKRLFVVVPHANGADKGRR